MEHLETARQYLEEINAHPPSKPNAIQRVLAELANMLQSLQHQCTIDTEKIQDLEKEFPEGKGTFIQDLSLLLSILPLHIKGERQLIEQAEGQVGERGVCSGGATTPLPLARTMARQAGKGYGSYRRSRAGTTVFWQAHPFLELGNNTDALVASERARARAFIDLLATREVTQEQLLNQSIEQSGINVPAVTMEEITEIVKRRQGMTIEYFLLEQKIVIWVLSADGNVTTLESPVSKDNLEAAILTLHQLLREPRPNTQQLALTSNILQKLYTYLLAPIPHALFPLSEEETITIIPHGLLFLVPFAALKENPQTHFIQKYPLIYSPSIHLLKYTHINQKQVIHAEDPNLLAFVNPAPFPDPDQPPLKFTDQHFDDITYFYQSKQKNTVLRGSNATKQTLWREAAQHTVLCFATHAQAFDTDPLASYLALARIPPEDGYLRVPEIFQLELHTDLVILSACETGLGKVSGDGVNGLSRAFIGAGTPSLLISLWPIPEEGSFPADLSISRILANCSPIQSPSTQAGTDRESGELSRSTKRLVCLCTYWRVRNMEVKFNERRNIT